MHDQPRLEVPEAGDFQRSRCVALPAGTSVRLLGAGEAIRLTDGTIYGGCTDARIQFVSAVDVGRRVGDLVANTFGVPVGELGRVGAKELIFRITDGLHDVDEGKLLELYEGNFAKEVAREAAWIRAAARLYFEKRQAGIPRAELKDLALEVARRMDEAKLQGRMEWDEETGVFLFFARGAEVESRDEFPE